MRGTYMQFDFKTLSDQFIDKVQTDLENAVAMYLGTVPFENCVSEHGLLYIRRRVVSFLDMVETGYRERCRLLLRDPILIEKARLVQNKPESEILYEIGKLLAEWGEYSESLSTFNKLLLDSNTSKEIIFMIKDAKAVVLQNTGLFDDAYNILVELIDGLKNQPSNPDTHSEAYFAFKHLATIIRRIEYQNLLSKKDEIINYLNRAAAAFDSYHINFSKGYLYYLLGDNISAKKEYEECMLKLGELDSADFYYMIHVKYILSIMLTTINKPRLHGRFRLTTPMNTHFVTYKKALNMYPNFKNGINELLVRIIEDLVDGRLNNFDILCEQLDTLVRSPEILHCITKDIFCIFDYFEQPDLKRRVEDKLRRIASRFIKMSKIAGSNSYVEVIPRQGLCICFDIREYVSLTKSDPSRACGCVHELGALTQEYLGEFIDDISFSGDGFIVLKNIDLSNQSIEFKNILFRVVDRIYQLFIRFESRYKDINLKLGAGIALGSVLRMSPANLDDESYFFGAAVNSASRMCNLAKPTGIVISAEALDQEVIFSLIRGMEFRRLQLPGKYKEEFDCLVSQRVIDYTGYTYFKVSNDELEKRVFLNYGGECNRDCQYCHAETEDSSGAFNKSLFLNELELLCHERLLDGNMFSIGHCNEPLDVTNYATTNIVVKALLERTSAVIQIATKIHLSEVDSFLSSIEPNDRARIFIFISLTCTIFSSELENRDISDYKQYYERKLSGKNYNLIGYVKPFLPGITDNDESLLDLLSIFPIIVVGYVYLSDRTMNRMWDFCTKNSLFSDRDYYSVYIQKYMQREDNTLPLLHPCQNESLTAYDYSKPVEAYVKIVQKHYPNSQIFRSSPCAIAYLMKSSCYTAVGSPLRELSKILCKGDDGCMNLQCIYNCSQIGNDVDKITSWLVHFYSDIPDKSHSLDHFLRVLHIARQIFNAIPDQCRGALTDQDLEILELCCLVHDLGDRKLSNSILMRNEVDKRAEKAVEILKKAGIGQGKVTRVAKIIEAGSFGDDIHGTTRKGFSENDNMICDILADADKIDAIGAIGIARCFGFKKNRGLFNVYEEPRNRKKLIERPGYASAFIHFFEKLLHLFKMLHRPESKNIAIGRHEYLRDFVLQFLAEYEEPFVDGSPEKSQIERLRKLANDTSWWDA
jgi:uncharacterized protein